MKMVRFTSLLVFALVSLSEARLQSSRTTKATKATKSTKSTKASKGAYKASKSSKYPVTIGSRPYFILDSMEDSDLKEDFKKCAEEVQMDKKSDWSIGHRGACMQVSISRLNVHSFPFTDKLCNGNLNISILSILLNLIMLLWFKVQVLLSVM